MTETLSNVPLAKYASSYEAIGRSKKNHVLTSGIALVAALILGGIAYLALTKGLLPNQPVTNILIASGAATFAFLGSLTGILLHYASTIVDKKREACHEAFFMALTHASTHELFTPFLEDDKRESCLAALKQFKSLMKQHYSNQDYKGLLYYLEGRFFSVEVHYAEELKLQVYSALYAAAPARFIRNYMEMRKVGECKDSAAYLYQMLTTIYKKMTPQEAVSLIDDLDTKEYDLLTTVLVDVQPDIFEHFSPKTLAKLLLMEDNATLHFPSQLLATQLSIELLEKDTLAINYIKAYFNVRDRISSQLKTVLDLLIAQKLDDMVPSQWAKIIASSDTKFLIKKGLAHTYLTPDALVEKMCAINLSKFAAATGNGATGRMNHIYEKYIEPLSDSRKQWLKDLHCRQVRYSCRQIAS
jgi:hypothetical protein